MHVDNACKSGQRAHVNVNDIVLYECLRTQSGIEGSDTSGLHARTGEHVGVYDACGACRLGIEHNGLVVTRMGGMTVL